MELPQTLIDAVHYFSDKERCEELLRDIRWPDGEVKCPHCKSTHVRYMISVNRWKCYAKHKRPQFSVRTGTCFEESAVPLSKWFICLYLIVNAKNGISSWEVHRAIGVTQRSSWFMLQRIRDGLKTRKRRLEGVVEVDESFHGGRYKWMHGDARRQKPRKTIVMGLYQRGGPVQTVVIPDRERPTLHRQIKSSVAPGSKLFTDDLRSYNGLKPFYHHRTVNHTDYAYVDGEAYTNNLEGYWSHLKRCIRSTYISVDPGHLPKYLTEQEFRWNSRTLKDGARFIEALKLVSMKKRITYKQLTQNHKRAHPRRGGGRKTATVIAAA